MTRQDGTDWRAETHPSAPDAGICKLLGARHPSKRLNDSVTTASKSNLQLDGLAMLPQVIDADGIQRVLDCLTGAEALSGARQRTSQTYAVRHLLWDVPNLACCLTQIGLDDIACELFGQPAFPISATFFDKNPDANWLVPGHQDLVMPVAERQTAEGFTGWNEKSGVTYVELPESVLVNLVALRLHLDDCSLDNGALAVVRASHLRGKLRDTEIAAIARETYQLCPANVGDVLAMKPLLVHRSSPAVAPSHRRVLHVVYAVEDPGQGVRWKRTAGPNLHTS